MKLHNSRYDRKFNSKKATSLLFFGANYPFKMNAKTQLKILETKKGNREILAGLLGEWQMVVAFDVHVFKKNEELSGGLFFLKLHVEAMSAKRFNLLSKFEIAHTCI